MINLVSGCCDKLFPKNVSCMGTGNPTRVIIIKF